MASRAGVKVAVPGGFTRRLRRIRRRCVDIAGFLFLLEIANATDGGNVL